MAKKNFLLLSLKENEAKKVAQAISNESCRKILDYLAERDATEEELSQKLGIPISTVHYNLQQLMQSKLVTVEEFHYSKKGREVNHYKLANKYIIIAPREERGIRTRLKSILPVGLITIAGAGMIQLYTQFFAKPMATFAAPLAAPAAMDKGLVAEQFARASAERIVASGAAEAAVASAASDAATAAANAAPEAVQEGAIEITHAVIHSSPNYALWFLIGGMFVMALVLLLDMVMRRGEK